MTTPAQSKKLTRFYRQETGQNFRADRLKQVKIPMRTAEDNPVLPGCKKIGFSTFIGTLSADQILIETPRGAHPHQTEF